MKRDGRALFLNLRPRIDRGFSLELAPADNAALQGPEHRFCDHEIHDLAVAEPLQNEPPQKRPVFLLLEQKRDHCGAKINRHEDGIVGCRYHEVARIELLAVLEIVRQRPQDLIDQGEVDKRRQKGERNLKHPDLRHGNEAQRAVTRIEIDMAMLPKTLEGAEGPAEPLFRKPRHGIRRFGPGDCFLIEENFIARSLDHDCQILILGERIGRKAAETRNGLAPPGADCPRHDGYAAQRR